MGLLEKLSVPVKGVGSESPAPSAAADSSNTQGDVDISQYDEVMKRIHNDIITEMNRRGASGKESMQKLINEFVDYEEYGIPRVDRPLVATELYNDITGYGPIESLIADSSISEIMVNGPDQVYVENKGKLTLTGIHFRDEAHLMNIIDRIVTGVGRHIDESSPMVDARLPDGSRVNVVISPVSLVGPVLTIRKFGSTPITAKDMIRFGTLNVKMLSFLEACVRGKLNVIVSGGTGSGKTTLLNVLSGFIPDDERIVTIEDAAEVQLHQDHVITLEARPANLEGKGAVTIRNLVTNALRMRPDRIIVGEVRSAETLDMLQAMNTGHDGSLTTLHANSSRDALARIETMVMMSGMELPLKAIRDQVASAIDIIVQAARLRDGSRKVISISEVVGMEGDTVSMQDLFKYETDGRVDDNGKFVGSFKATGIRPFCLEKIRACGVNVNNDWFNN